MARKVPSKWIRSEADERAVAAGYVFDERAAQHVVDFARQFCKHSQGRWAGQPFELQDWQYNDFILPVYGWHRPDGTRRYRRAHIEVPKKNGKSALASMLSLYHLIADGEPGAVVANAAVDRDQAGIVFDAAAAMVRASAELSAHLDVIDSRKVIVHPASTSKYVALSADVASKEGLNLSALILDELHRWKPAMFTTLTYAGAARTQPMFIAITTAGTYDESSIGWQQHEYARRVLSGEIDDLGFFALIFAADPAADWTDPATWAAANPSIDVTVTREELAEQCAAAQHSVGLENSFRRYRLNQWTQSTERWISLSTFDASFGHAIDERAYAGKAFHAGIDLGSVSDLSVVAELFTCPNDPGAIDLVLRAFLPSEALRESPNAHLYQQWSRDGHLTLTSGNVTDENAILTVVRDDAKRGTCRSVGVDRLYQAMRLSQDLAAGGLDVHPCSMSIMSLSPLVIELEKLILTRKFHHGGCLVLRAAIDAVEMEVDAAGNRRPTRVNRHKKIDALIAVLIALDRVLRAEPEQVKPQYQAYAFGGGPNLWRGGR